jgi:hypothetical protein
MQLKTKESECSQNSLDMGIRIMEGGALRRRNATARRLLYLWAGESEEVGSVRRVDEQSMGSKGAFMAASRRSALQFRTVQKL